MKFLKVIAGIVVLGAAAWFWFFPTYHHRYTMTVEVLENGQLRTGTGVVDVSYQWQGPVSGIMNGNRAYGTVFGRAPIVELSNGGLLIALISDPTIADYEPTPEGGLLLAIRAYYGDKYWHDEKANRDRYQDVLRSISSELGPRELSTNGYPVFVWLPDPKNQRSAVPAPPSKLSNVVGLPVKISRVTVEISNAPITNEIFERLPWLSEAVKYQAKHLAVNDPKNFVLWAYYVLGVSDK